MSSIYKRKRNGINDGYVMYSIYAYDPLRNKKRSFLIITHYQRLLDYIKPDFVHVLMNGKIAKTGCSELALELEKAGYEKI